jgi:hypothetical protein
MNLDACPAVQKRTLARYARLSLPPLFRRVLLSNLQLKQQKGVRSSSGYCLYVPACAVPTNLTYVAGRDLIAATPVVVASHRPSSKKIKRACHLVLCAGKRQQTWIGSDCRCGSMAMDQVTIGQRVLHNHCVRASCILRQSILFSVFLSLLFWIRLQCDVLL